MSVEIIVGLYHFLGQSLSTVATEVVSTLPEEGQDWTINIYDRPDATCECRLLLTIHKPATIHSGRFLAALKETVTF